MSYAHELTSPHPKSPDDHPLDRVTLEPAQTARRPGNSQRLTHRQHRMPGRGDDRTRDNHYNAVAELHGPGTQLHRHAAPVPSACVPADRLQRQG